MQKGHPYKKNVSNGYQRDNRSYNTQKNSSYSMYSNGNSVNRSNRSNNHRNHYSNTQPQYVNQSHSSSSFQQMNSVDINHRNSFSKQQNGYYEVEHTTKTNNWQSSNYSNHTERGNRYFSNDSSFAHNDLFDQSLTMEPLNSQLSDGDSPLPNQSTHNRINSISLLPPPDQSTTTILPSTNLDELNSSGTSNHPMGRHSLIAGYSDSSALNSPSQTNLLSQPPGLLPNPNDSSSNSQPYSRRIPLIPTTEDDANHSIYYTDHTTSMYENYPRTSLYHTDYSIYDDYPNTSLYHTDDGYDDSSIHWNHHPSQKGHFTPPDYPYPGGSLYRSDMGMPNPSYHSTTMSSTLYQADHPGYSESIYQTDHTDYSSYSNYPSLSGYSSYSSYSRLPPYPQSKYHDTVYSSDYPDGYTSGYSSRPMKKPSILPSSTFHSDYSSSSHYPAINSNLHLINKVDEKQMNAILELHKKGNLEEALDALIQLKEEVSPSISIYLEMIRIYIDQGDYHHAEETIEESLQVFPKDDQLIEKWIRVEERLGNVTKIIQGIKLLLEKTSYSVIKNVVETCLNLCKLNHSIQASLYLQSLFNKGLFKQSNLLWNYSIFLYRSISIPQAVDMLRQSLQQFPKYGPMWFTLFQYLEQQCIAYWDCKSFIQRIMTCTIFQSFQEAIQSISTELRWKVYYIATQMVLRTLVHQRIVLHSNITHIQEYLEYESFLYGMMKGFLIRCFYCCPNNLKWKVFLLMGRVSAFQGKRSLCNRFFERSTHFTPSRTFHPILFEISRILEYSGNMDGMKDVISVGMKHMPSEWKVALERIHQYMKEGDYHKALELNREVVMNNKGAGRLWASFIQIVHQTYGPIIAFCVFVYSLQYVAKSGEVWCEGGRIFLNPCSSLFSIHNAQYCLNLAVYFTPQYGDSFIEILRLFLLTSEVFLSFSSTANTYLLYHLLISLPCSAILARGQYSDPNYGSCWFKVKIFPLSSAEEVLTRALKYVAWELVLHADLYREALLREAKQKREQRLSPNGGKMEEKDLFIHPSFRYYTFAFKPDQMFCSHEEISSIKRMMLLFGTSQIEA